MTRGRILVPVQHLADNERGETPFAVPASAIGLEEVPGDVHGIATVTRIDHRLRVHCVAEAERPAVCDRCLGDFDEHLRAEFEQWFVFGGTTGDEEAVSLAPEDRYVVLDKEVREQLILAEPMKALCREDCKGLCPECGVNLNERSCEHVHS